MDNICHTLVGAALAKSGLERRTALGGATLMIGANFPDIDVVAVPLGMSFEWRRGVTHGLLALIVLPFVLTSVMLAWDHFVRRRRAGTSYQPADLRGLLLLSTLSMLTHPVLDWMNVYGVRWLMPFDGTWFYGDALFIVDPWIWGALAVGVVASRRRWRAGDPAPVAGRPAVIAMALASTYIVGMLVLGEVGERIARRGLAVEGVRNVDRIMVGPVPVNPLRRQVVASVDSGGQYRFGEVQWAPGASFALEEFAIQSNSAHPAAVLAQTTPRGSGFVQWARFPFWVIDRREAHATVWIGDARYTVDPEVSWAAVRLDIAVE
jgi:inner membrane protein